MVFCVVKLLLIRNFIVVKVNLIDKCVNLLLLLEVGVGFYK